jgi:hypothetical protein
MSTSIRVVEPERGGAPDGVVFSGIEGWIRLFGGGGRGRGF